MHHYASRGIILKRIIDTFKSHVCVLFNIMFHAPMGRFQLELIYCFTFMFHRRSIQQLYVPVL